MRYSKRFCLILTAFALASGVSRADALRGSDVIGPTNIDWMALMRAQKSVRMGKPVEFVWPEYPRASFAEIRRALWIAGLHSLTNQNGTDEQTRRLMEPELKEMKERLQNTIDYDVAIRDLKPAEALVPLLVQAQVRCLLIDLAEPSPVKSPLNFKANEVFVENSDIAFPSLPIAVNFTRSCLKDSELIFDEKGRVATDILVCRFLDGSATVVNLTDEMRHGLTYHHDRTRLTFDLFPADVVHLQSSNPPQPTHTCNERFITGLGLWQVSFDGALPVRILDAMRLGTIVSETYRGEIRYKTTVCIPAGEGELLLGLDTGNSETEVSIDGKSLGIRAWQPFEWAIPGRCRGRNLPIEIRIVKRTNRGALQAVPGWRSR